MGSFARSQTPSALLVYQADAGSAVIIISFRLAHVMMPVQFVTLSPSIADRSNDIKNVVADQ